LDNVAAIIEGRPISAAAQRTRELQSLPVEEAMAIAREQRELECCYERCLWITWNARVAQCMEWYADGRELVPDGFLETPLDKILEARRTSAFCRACRERAIHRCYVVYGDEKLAHPCFQDESVAARDGRAKA
jgi:hypothetical protein